MASFSPRLSSLPRGVALIEVIIFMVVIAVAAGAMLSVFARTSLASSQMLVNRQALAIGEAMLDEVMAAPFTFCDPNPRDPNFLIATSPAGCASASARETVPGGKEAGETRFGARRFDNVNDYDGFAMGPGIRDRTNAIIAGSRAFSLTVAVSRIPGGGTWNGMARSEMALVTVTVTSRQLAGPVVVEGLRSRYLPWTAPL